MKIALVFPPFKDFYTTPHRLSMLGIKTIEKILFKNDYNSKLFAFPIFNELSAVEIPETLNYLKEFIIPNETGGTSFFTGLKHFGPAFKKCAELIKEYDPDIILISCFAFCYGDDAIELACKCREIMPKAQVVFGGGGASAYPEYFLSEICIDFVIKGEAEISLVSFLQELQKPAKNFNNVPNLYWKHDNKVIPPVKIKYTQAEELEFVLNKTQKKNIDFYSTVLTRGCPKNCGFCSNHICHGKEFRKAPEEIILKEIKNLNVGSKQVHFNFEDDNFLLDKNYFLKVLNIFKSVFDKASFSAENGMDYSLLDNHMLKILLENNFTQLNLSLGSLDDDILSCQNRNMDLEKYLNIIKYLNEKKIFSITYFIAGLPNDSIPNVLKTLSFLHKISTLIGISMFYPVPGIKNFSDFSLFSKNKSALCMGSSAYPWAGSLSSKELITSFRLARFSNLTKVKKISEIDKEIISKTISKQRLFTAVKENKSIEIIPIPNLADSMVKSFLTMI